MNQNDLERELDRVPRANPLAVGIWVSVLIWSFAIIIAVAMDWI